MNNCSQIRILILMNTRSTTDNYAEQLSISVDWRIWRIFISMRTGGQLQRVSAKSGQNGAEVGRKDLCSVLSTSVLIFGACHYIYSVSLSLEHVIIYSLIHCLRTMVLYIFSLSLSTEHVLIYFLYPCLRSMSLYILSIHVYGACHYIFSRSMSTEHVIIYSLYPCLLSMS